MSTKTSRHLPLLPPVNLEGGEVYIITTNKEARAMNAIRYFEVDMACEANGQEFEYSMCIKATGLPTFEEAAALLRADIEREGWALRGVTFINETTLAQAAFFYDLTRESQWPILRVANESKEG